MSTKYKYASEVPTKLLAKRLDELSTEIAKGRLRQFVMRVPAEVDYCPDLVMSASATRLLVFEMQITELKGALDKAMEYCTINGVLGLDSRCTPEWFVKAAKLLEENKS